MHDLVITNGTVVDGSGGEPVRGDVAVDGDRIVAVGALDDTDARRTIDAEGCLVTPWLRRHPHPPRRAAGVGSDGVVVVLARRDLGGARQLRRHLRPLQARRPRRAGRDDGVGRGHPGRQHHGRPGLGLVELRRVPRCGGALAQGHQRRRHGRALRGARARHGRAEPRRGPGHGRRHRPHVRARRRGHRRRRAGLLDLANAAAPGARRPPRARHVGRRGGAAGDRGRHGATRAAACSRPRPASASATPTPTRPPGPRWT